MELIYHHFKSMGVQELLRERYLPIDLSAVQNDEERGGVVNDYIIEPSAAQLIADLNSAGVESEDIYSCSRF